MDLHSDSNEDKHTHWTGTCVMLNMAYTLEATVKQVERDWVLMITQQNADTELVLK